MYRLGDKWLENSPMERNLGVLVGVKFNLSLAARRVNCTLRCIKPGTAFRWGKKLSCSALLLQPDLQHWVQVWVPQHKNNIKLLERIQRRATKGSVPMTPSCWSSHSIWKMFSDIGFGCSHGEPGVGHYDFCTFLLTWDILWCSLDKNKQKSRDRQELLHHSVPLPTGTLHMIQAYLSTTLHWMLLRGNRRN